MKRGICIIAVLLLLIALTACDSGQPAGNGTDAGVTAQPSEPAKKTVLDMLLDGRPRPEATPTEGVNPDTPTATPTVSPTPTLSPTPTPLPLEDGMEEITWGLYAWNRPDPAAQNRINQLLEAKGCNCRVRFVNINFLTDEALTKWLEKYEQRDGVLDILNAGAWSSPEAANTFAETYFLPLNSMLETESGQAFRALWSNGAWARVTSADGTVYAVPRANAKTDVSSCFNAGIYITVSEEYREFFADFDGTYRSLRDIYDKIGQDDLVIELSCGFTDRLLNAMMGYQDYAGIPYNPKKQTFINLAKTDELTKLTAMVKADFENGITVRCAEPIDWSPIMDGSTSNPAERDDNQSAAVDGKKTLAVIHEGIRSAQDGFFELCMAEDPYYYNCALSYGINKNSEKKELAAAILYACYSDPEIAALLNPDSDDFTHVEERLAITAGEQAGQLAGFADYASVKDYPAVNELIDLFDPVFGYEDEIPETVDLDIHVHSRYNPYTKLFRGMLDKLHIRFFGVISPDGKKTLSASIFGQTDQPFNVDAKATIYWLDLATGICGSPIRQDVLNPNTADGHAACVRYGFLSDDTRFIYMLSSFHHSCHYNENMEKIAQYYLTEPLTVVK